MGQVLNLSDNLISLAGRLVPALTIFTVKKGGFVFGWKLSGFPVFQIMPIVFVLSQNKNEKNLALSFSPSLYVFIHIDEIFLLWVFCSSGLTVPALPVSSMSNLPILSATLWPLQDSQHIFYQLLVQVSYHLSFPACQGGPLLNLVLILENSTSSPGHNHTGYQCRDSPDQTNKPTNSKAWLAVSDGLGRRLKLKVQSCGVISTLLKQSP